MRSLRSSNAARSVAAIVIAIGCIVARVPEVFAQAPAGKIEAVDLALPAVPWLVLPATWQGKPALMVYTRGEAAVPGAPGGARLSVFALRPTGWANLGEWALPPGTRWVEPLRLHGGETGWLMLVGPEVRLGRVTAAGLTSQTLCNCPSLYSQADPEELGTRLARDLDGDGADEVVLPTPRGLSVYRVIQLGTHVGTPFALVPLGLALWQPDGAELSPAKIPELIPLMSRNGSRLVQLQRDVLVSYRLPPDLLARPITLNAETRAHVPPTLPEPVRTALAKVPDEPFADAAALVTALEKMGALSEFAPHVATILTALGGWAEVKPELSTLSGLNQRAEDRGFLLALEDLNGDGVPDLVHGLVRNESQILKAESELRFYAGATSSPLSFGGPQVIKASGPAVAALLRLSATAHVLLIARTEASLGAIFRAMSSKELKVEASAYPVGSGGLGTSPLRREELTFKGFEEGSQVIAIPANLAGNGHPALLMNLRPDEISIYFSDGAGPDFDKPSGRLVGPLPRKAEETLVGDFQGEGRESVVFWYRGRKHSDAQRRVLRVLRWVPG